MLHQDARYKTAVTSARMVRGGVRTGSKAQRSPVTFLHFFLPIIFPKQAGDSGLGTPLSNVYWLVVSQFMNNLTRQCPMFHHVFVQTQMKPGAGFLGPRSVERKASWGLFHLPASKPRHTGQSLFKVWQFGRNGMANDKNAWVSDGETPPLLPQSFTPPKLLRGW